MDESSHKQEPSWVKKRWLLHVTLGLFLLLLFWVAVLIWKVVSADKQVEIMPEAVLQAPLPQQHPSPKPLMKQAVQPPHVEPPLHSETVIKANPHDVDSPLPTPTSAPPLTKQASSGLALIVDDMGNDVGALKRFLALSIPLTISILPNTPHAVRVATMTHQAGQTVMLHLPMEPMGDYYRHHMDDSFLRVGMDEATVRLKILKDLANIPYVEGINNHMGSRLTSMIEPMAWVMQVCKEQSLFFVDSKTSSKSLAATVAKQYGLTWGSRAIFLDDSVQAADMQKSWHRMEACVQAKKRCIVIVHPHRQSLDFLEHQLDTLQHWPMRPLRALLHAAPQG